MIYPDRTNIPILTMATQIKFRYRHPVKGSFVFGNPPNFPVTCHCHDARWQSHEVRHRWEGCKGADRALELVFHPDPD